MSPMSKSIVNAFYTFICFWVVCFVFLTEVPTVSFLLFVVSHLHADVSVPLIQTVINTVTTRLKILTLSHVKDQIHSKPKVLWGS